MKMAICGVALLGALMIVSAEESRAQSTTYYITDGFSRVMHIVESGVLVDTVPTYFNADPLAVRDTILLGHRDDTEAREYTLAGVPTGETFTGNGSFSQIRDGTTDGVQFNYGIECCGTTNSVIVADLNWENSQELFSIPFNGQGIAYDTRTDHLFTSTSGDTMIREYDLAGTLVNSFSTVAASNFLIDLAYEESTDTLWGKVGGGGTLYQFSKSGTLLDTVVIPGLSPFSDSGGEMRIVPEPASLLLNGTALLALAALAVRRRGGA